MPSTPAIHNFWKFLLAIKWTAEMDSIKYGIFLVYALFYGFFGTTFSLLTEKAAPPVATKDA
jgi:hypothetical protein